MSAEDAGSAVKITESAEGFTLRDLDAFISLATTAGIDWDALIYVRDTKIVKMTAPGLSFRQLTAVAPKVDRWRKK